MAAQPELLLGRKAELAQIAAFLEAEPPAALVLEGEAGIGKTRVWEEGVRMASAPGGRVLAVRAAGSEVQLSFAGLADLLGGVVDEALPGLPAPQRHALEAALLLVEAEGELPDARAVAAGLLTVLRLLSATAPLVLAIDDLQWLDSSSGGALRFALRRLETEPVRLLATVRGSPGGPLPLELERAFGDDRLLRIALAPLSLGTLHELLRARLGLNLPRPALVRVAEVCSGNPFFALELGRELQRRGARPAAGEPLPVPSNLRQLVRDRIARLPARTRLLVLSAAALAHPTVAILAAASGDAAADLDRAVRGGVLEVEGERVRFTHPLLAAATYSQASASDRRAVHRALARAATEPQERARHLALAATGASEDIAAALDDAAVHARRRGAPDAAADLCEQAIRLTPAKRTTDRYRRTLTAAEYRFLAGDTARARSLLDDLVAAAPPGPGRARALLLLARIAFVAEGSEAAVALGERALAEPIQDPALEAEAHVNLAGFADSTTVVELSTRSARSSSSNARRAPILRCSRPRSSPTRWATTTLAVGFAGTRSSARSRSSRRRSVRGLRGRRARCSASC